MSKFTKHILTGMLLDVIGAAAFILLLLAAFNLAEG